MISFLQSPKVILIFWESFTIKSGEGHSSTQARKRQLSPKCMVLGGRDISWRYEIQILVPPCLLCDSGQLTLTSLKLHLSEATV